MPYFFQAVALPALPVTMPASLHLFVSSNAGASCSSLYFPKPTRATPSFSIVLCLVVRPPLCFASLAMTEWTYCYVASQRPPPLLRFVRNDDPLPKRGTSVLRSKLFFHFMNCKETSLKSMVYFFAIRMMQISIVSNQVRAVTWVFKNPVPPRSMQNPTGLPFDSSSKCFSSESKLRPLIPIKNFWLRRRSLCMCKTLKNL